MCLQCKARKNKCPSGANKKRRNAEMKKILAALLVLIFVVSPMLSAPARADAPEPITLTVFRGDPGDQPAEDNKIYQKNK